MSTRKEKSDKEKDSGTVPLRGLFSPKHEKDDSTGNAVAGGEMDEFDYRQDDNAGSLSHLQNLFQQYPSSAIVTGADNKNCSAARTSPSANAKDDDEEQPLQRKNTRKGSNTTKSKMSQYTSNSTERTGLLDSNKISAGEMQRSSAASYDSSTLSDLFQSPGSSQKTPKAGPSTRKTGALPLHTSSAQKSYAAYNKNNNSSSNHSAPKNTTKKEHGLPFTERAINTCKEAGKEMMTPSTWIGAFVFVVYHVVFCLAAGSAIQRPHAKNSILGLMTKMAALGIMFAGPFYLYNIGNDIPSMYPTCDLFLAPILASISKSIDQDLAEDPSISEEENDEVFLATFAFLAFVGMALAGVLLITAGVFRLANLGSFLPFPVLCGFFAAVGILTWHLGFVVDTSGKTFHTVFFSGDPHLILNALIHHLPGVGVAVLMKYLGPKNPFYVVLVLFATIAAVYAVLFATGTSLEEARSMGWFWHYEDIVYENMTAKVGFKKWLPPAPFGMVSGLFLGKIHWPSVAHGLQSSCVLSLLYLIRCALHSAALLKNVPNLARSVKVTKPDPETATSTGTAYPRKKTRLEKFSEMVDIEEVMQNVTGASKHSATAMEIERAKPTSWTLQSIMIQYGVAQSVSALVGGFGIIPSVATSHAMFSLKAEKVGPQIGSILLLSIFYLTDFRLIAFVPKMAFSCLLSLAFIDMVTTWVVKSYFKTKEKMEWYVVPVIVVAAFAVGLLEAVFFGIAISTFLFVAAFFRSGVVKFASSGLSVRSTIERPFASAQWLDEHGDQIQIVILQNYLFFGNASSIFAYVSSMFEEPDAQEDEYMNLPPLPKFIVLDLALVTGIDTSTVDIISDILNLCSKHDCKLFLSGMSPNLRSVLAHAGVKPLTGERAQRKLRFFSTFDTALGKAEDMLLESHLQEKPQSFRKLLALGEESGFHLALRRIDEQHGTNFSEELLGLEEYTTPIELEPNESLYDSPSRPERGLFFIEEGILKIERDASLTAGTRSLRTFRGPNQIGDGSISELKLRSSKMGLQYAKLKEAHAGPQLQSFRLARVFPGWVLGTIEAVSGMENAGVHLAVTSCRLHYLSNSKMDELETSHPLLMLRLYKLLSNIMAKQQELTIGQLSTLHAIISSPARTKPLGRKAALTFQKLQK